jgi:hypothetical protein
MTAPATPKVRRPPKGRPRARYRPNLKAPARAVAEERLALARLETVR